MSTEVFLPGIAEFDRSPIAGAPLLTETYRKSLEDLVMIQDEGLGVTHFYGGPLDLGKGRDVWMSPVEVDDGETYSYFQLLYVNTSPEEALHTEDFPVSILEVDEASFKLTPADHPGYEQLIDQLSADQKHIVIRRCYSGSAYFPRVITPPTGPIRDDHIERIVATTGFREPEVVTTLRKTIEAEENPIISSRIEAIHSRVYQFGGSAIHSYGLLLPDDPWKYYELYTPRPIEDISTKNLLVRIDSGCDIGQIYNDNGCDCREQLHSTLRELQDVNDGVIIHIPGQDGRGFGAATKMETEGLKRGIRVITNQRDLRPMDTVAAAQHLLGRDFDIRTYEGAGKILNELGIDSIRLNTDNRLKVQGMLENGITVRRQATGTTGANGSLGHVQAKHQHADIYFGEHE